MRSKTLTWSVLLMITLVLCGAPQMLQAQATATPASPQGDAQGAAAPAQGTQGPNSTDTQAAPQTQTAPQASPGPLTVDPSKGPLQPVPEENPEPPQAPSAVQQQQAPAQPAASQANTAPAQANTTQQPSVQEPVGVAAAEKGVTAGGAGSKPAGSAIAPAKQHQVRSLLIKLGAIGAGAAALGAIFALSKGTSSTPPGTR
jgi:cytoskeletal protein RodZ